MKGFLAALRHVVRYDPALDPVAKGGREANESPPKQRAER
jgi:hypothetical protein